MQKYARAQLFVSWKATATEERGEEGVKTEEVASGCEVWKLLCLNRHNTDAPSHSKKVVRR